MGERVECNLRNFEEDGDSLAVNIPIILEAGCQKLNFYHKKSSTSSKVKEDISLCNGIFV